MYSELISFTQVMKSSFTRFNNENKSQQPVGSSKIRKRHKRKRILKVRSIVGKFSCYHAVTKSEKLNTKLFKTVQYVGKIKVEKFV
jgi:hypothetical protein